MQSRAIVFLGDGTWEERSFPVPDPQPGGAILRVEATGLCHSDVHQFHGGAGTPRGATFPVVPGHEIVGRIDRITPAAKAEWGVDEGDRVGVRTIAITAEGIRAYGLDFPVVGDRGLHGGYAEYLELVPGSMVHRLRDDISAAECTVFESLSSTVTWVESVRTGDVVVVEGPGHMGLATVVAARAAGAAAVIVTGLASDGLRLAAARAVGADHVIDVEAVDPVARVAELTDGVMADVVVDAASGNPVTVRLGMEMVRRGGTVVVAGFKDRPLDGFEADWIPMRQITLRPGAGLDAARAADLVNSGAVPTAAMLGDVFPFERFDEAFALLERRLPGRDTVRAALSISSG